MTLVDQCVKRACFFELAKPGAIAPTPASRQGPWLPPVVGGNSIVYAVWSAASFDDHLKSVPSTHIRCRTTASFRATATLALRSPLRFASRMPQALSVDHFATRVSSTLAASKGNFAAAYRRVSRFGRSTLPEAYRRVVIGSSVRHRLRRFSAS